MTIYVTPTGEALNSDQLVVSELKAVIASMTVSLPTGAGALVIG